MQNSVLRILHGCLPITEVVNDLMPRFWRTNAVMTPTVLALGPREEPFLMTADETMCLSRHIWVRAYQRRVHALTEYRSSDGGYRLWIPTVGVGFVASSEQKIEALADLYSGFLTESSTWFGERAAPPGAVYLVPDRLAGIQVTMQLAKDIPKAVVTADGEVVEQLTPVPPLGYLHLPVEQPNRQQHPVSFREWLQEPGRSATYGATPYRAFRQIGVSPGVAPTRLADIVGIPRSEMRPVINRFKKEGLVKEKKIIRVAVTSQALKNRTRRAELDVDEKKVLVPLRLPTEQDVRKQADFVLELDVDPERVVGITGAPRASTIVLVSRVSSNSEELIEEQTVPVRTIQTQVTVDVKVAGMPITVTCPLALGDVFRGTGLYLTHSGEALSARMDRQSPEIVRGRFGEYQTVRGHIRKASHDSRGHHLQAHFLKKGGNRKQTAAIQRWFATSGMRMVINFSNVTQIAPDLWLIIPTGDGLGVLVAVEIEQTAVTFVQVLKKLGPYDVAIKLDAEIPMLMACKEGAVQRFLAVGRPLPMLAASFQDAGEDRWATPNLNPDFAARIVDAQHLTRREWRNELVQRFDLML